MAATIAANGMGLYESRRGPALVGIAALLAQIAAYGAWQLLSDERFAMIAFVLQLPVTAAYLTWKVRGITNRRTLGLPDKPRSALLYLGYLIAIGASPHAIPFVLAYDDLRTAAPGVRPRVAAVAAFCSWLIVARFASEQPGWIHIPITCGLGCLAWMWHELERAEAKLARQLGVVELPTTF